MSKKQIRDAADTVGNATTQVLTGGLVGLENGQVKQGIGIRAVDEALGEVTGRNIQRRVANENAAMVRKAAADAEEERKLQLNRRKQQEINASNAAQAIISSATTGNVSSPSSAGVSQVLGSEFLGV